MVANSRNSVVEESHIAQKAILYQISDTPVRNEIDK